jgi:inner membrane protein
MRAPAHRLTGLASGVIAWSLLPAWVPMPWLAVITGAMGGNAPDALEWIGGLRWISHRTVTHWLPLWIAILGTGIGELHAPLGPALVGYGLGGLTHLLFDVPNPRGIPLLTPWRRITLDWWQSGRHDGLLVVGWGALAALCVWLRLRS